MQEPDDSDALGGRSLAAAYLSLVRQNQGQLQWFPKLQWFPDLSGSRLKLMGIDPLPGRFSRAVLTKHIRDPRFPGLSKRFAGFVPDLFVRDVWPQLPRLFLPPNLRPIDGLHPRDLFDLLDEGIPLFLVPRARIAKRLLAAPSATARRDVIGACFDDILTDCERSISSHLAGRWSAERDAIQEAIDVARAGHYRAAQAMAAVVADAFTWTWVQTGGIEQDSWNMLTRKRKYKDSDAAFFEQWSISALYAWRPMWASYREYRPNSTDKKVPREFSRHASLHTVDPRQYTKRNTAIAIMLATSLLGYMTRFG